jgi:hypothetical protein
MNSKNCLERQLNRNSFESSSFQGNLLSLDDLLETRSISSFVKKYFEGQNARYTQILSVSNGLITCRTYINGEMASESTEDTFNKARVKAAILAMQECNIELLKKWLSIHKDELQRYLNA